LCTEEEGASSFLFDVAGGGDELSGICLWSVLDRRRFRDRKEGLLVLFGSLLSGVCFSLGTAGEARPPCGWVNS